MQTGHQPNRRVGDVDKNGSVQFLDLSGQHHLVGRAPRDGIFS